MSRRKPQVCKVDGNHNEITNHLRACDWAVLSLARIGRGAPDVAVSIGPPELGIHVLLEFKMPGEKLNEFEEKWHRTWRGKVWVVYSPEEAEAVCRQQERDLWERMKAAMATERG